MSAHTFSVFVLADVIFPVRCLWYRGLVMAFYKRLCEVMLPVVFLAQLWPCGENKIENEREREIVSQPNTRQSIIYPINKKTVLASKVSKFTQFM